MARLENAVSRFHLHHRRCPPLAKLTEHQPLERWGWDHVENSYDRADPKIGLRIHNLIDSPDESHSQTITTT